MKYLSPQFFDKKPENIDYVKMRYEKIVIEISTSTAPHPQKEDTSTHSPSPSYAPTSLPQHYSPPYY